MIDEKEQEIRNYNARLKECWQEILLLLKESQQDHKKNIEKRNISAGVRIRNSVRELKNKIKYFLKQSIERDELILETRKSSEKEENRGKHLKSAKKKK